MLTSDNTHSPPSRIALVGVESVGKSAIFRQLTGDQSGVETNVKGSTINPIKSIIKGQDQAELVDTPGIRYEDDNVTTQLALKELKRVDQIVLVLKSASLKEELLTLMKQISLRGKKVTIVVTHKDKYNPSTEEKKYIKELLGVQIIWCNSRNITDSESEEIITALQHPIHWKVNQSIVSFLPESVLQPTPFIQRLFLTPILGPSMALLFLLTIFAGPVYLAYIFSDWLQPLADQFLITPLKESLTFLPQFAQGILVGDYGLLTLGWYSFLWAFPVVFFIGLSVAITEEIGIQEYITHTLNPWLRKIGLNGRDLIAVLTGFGCNVVAVMQTRGCSSCTRHACVSMISFGSACSYQIGASLSIFSSVGAPMLFFPYILLLFLVGAIHTRIWNRNQVPVEPVQSLPYIQSITLRGLYFRVKSVVKQFLLQAMPIFLLICFVASFLQMFSIMSFLASMIGPFLNIFALPTDVAPGILFSMIRKDGVMILNQGNGDLLSDMVMWKVFLTVYLASTISSCMVTLFTIYKEMGWSTSLKVFSKQFATSTVSTGVIALLFILIY
ncbi:nucleoside recognition domain-containing protein [Pontibacillus salicampi]|uniref:Nucleoside recognition domain-containing protein n=1 Tax=Pontibacillus salicampi TaxID=1449801 RepID=A0ABV6LKL9_9BACI